AGTSMISAYLIGAVGMGTGAYLATRPYEDDMTPEERDDHESMRALGVGVIGAGALMLGWGIVEDIRQMDSEEHIGRVALDKNVKTTDCDRGPFAGKRLELVNADNPSFVLTGTTNEKGHFHTQVSGAELRKSGAAFAASIGDINLGTVSLHRVLELRGEIERKAEAERREAEKKREEKQREAEKKAEAERGAAAATAARDAYEQSTGECHPDRRSQIEAQYTQAMSSLSLFRMLEEKEHKVVLAGGASGQLVYRVPYTGEYHFFVLGNNSIDLKVENSQGTESRLTSGVEHIVQNYLGFPHIESRAMRFTGSDQATIRVSGSGCALVVVFEVTNR
ncbi:MAG: hypothetical protein U1E22_09340, partial [Coriobacteriia bacterium]|nr:hypothetical protein [Coriobacteriia bacterium]